MNIIADKSNIKIGTKVIRGRDWSWGDQDKNSIFGVVQESTGEFPKDSDSAWVKVKWSNGSTYTYRIKSSFDLYLYEEPIPDKWCVKITEENKPDLEKYLQSNKHKYLNFNSNWTILNSNNYYLHSDAPNIDNGWGGEKIREGYTEITFEQFKQKTMLNKVKKVDLIELIGKDSCSDFNAAIKEVLASNYLLKDNDLIQIPSSYISRLGECSEKQLNLLKQIGIEKEQSKWSRIQINKKENYYFSLGRSIENGFQVKSYNSSDNNLAYTFETKELAEKEVKYYSLLLLMRNWARYHNKIDDFNPSPITLVYGIGFNEGNLRINNGYKRSRFFLGNVYFKTEERAQECLKEFEDDIKEIQDIL